MAKCRDCGRCTESGMTSAAMRLPRSLLTLAGGWMVSLFKRHCPQCRHWLSGHRQIAGRFAD